VYRPCNAVSGQGRAKRGARRPHKRSRRARAGARVYPPLLGTIFPPSIYLASLFLLAPPPPPLLPFSPPLPVFMASVPREAARLHFSCDPTRPPGGVRAALPSAAGPALPGHGLTTPWPLCDHHLTSPPRRGFDACLAVPPPPSHGGALVTEV
jgi:hypothetical protein